MRLLPCLVTLLFCLSAAAQVPLQGLPVATGSGPLEVSGSVELLRSHRDRGGIERQKFVPATQLRAGEELHYTLRVHNPGSVAIRDVVVVKRLPYGVVYSQDSAVGPDCTVEFSVDGGQRFASAARLRPSGGDARRADPAEYTHLRWTLRRGLAPGATALLRFRASLQ